jgi:DNA-binding protein H-NS
MQTMIPRLNEASKLQHQAEQQPIVTQHSQTAAMQARVERAQHQVTHKAPAEQAAIHKDGGGQGSGGNQRQQQPKKPAAKAEPAKGQAAEPGLGQRLDVKI